MPVRLPGAQPNPSATNGGVGMTTTSPTGGKPGVMPTPCAEIVTPNLRADLPKLGAEKSGRMNDLFARKRGSMSSGDSWYGPDK
jgi:hypothetical protein